MELEDLHKLLNEARAKGANVRIIGYRSTDGTVADYDLHLHNETLYSDLIKESEAKLRALLLEDKDNVMLAISSATGVPLSNVVKAANGIANKLRDKLATGGAKETTYVLPGEPNLDRDAAGGVLLKNVSVVRSSKPQIKKASKPRSVEQDVINRINEMLPVTDGMRRFKLSSDSFVSISIHKP